MLNPRLTFACVFVCISCCCITRTYAAGAGNHGGTGQDQLQVGAVFAVVTQTLRDICSLGVSPHNFFEYGPERDFEEVVGYLSGMPASLGLRLTWSKAPMASGSKGVPPLPPEKWYEDAEFDVRAVSGGAGSALKPVLQCENLAWEDRQRSSEWAIPWESTVNLRGKYRIVAKWQGVMAAERYIYFREATNDLERAYVYLARAQFALANQDYGATLTNAQLAERTEGGYVDWRWGGWSSAALLADAFCGLGRFGESVAAKEEYFRRECQRGTDRYDAAILFIKDMKEREAAAKVKPQPSALPINIAAKWDGKKAGDVETLDLGDGVLLRMVWCPAGSYVRGSPDGERGRRDDEKQHAVSISSGFWMGQCEVTIQQWSAVMGKPIWQPAFLAKREVPKVDVSWDMCQSFIDRLNATFPGIRFRLPTEAEWEYACRAGTVSPFHCGDEVSSTAVAFYDYERTTNAILRHEMAYPKLVKSYASNNWGLHDMHGNVWEWCQDRYGSYPMGSVTNPVGPSAGTLRVNRGGSTMSSAADCRSARRHGDMPHFRSFMTGLRLVAEKR